MMAANSNDRVSMRWCIGEEFVMVASDGGAEEGGGGSVHLRLSYPYQTYVPQSTVLGHCLASGLVSGSQLVVLQLTAPGVPDLPAPTPHFVAHPLGSACTQLPNSVRVK